MKPKIAWLIVVSILLLGAISYLLPFLNQSKEPTTTVAAEYSSVETFDGRGPQTRNFAYTFETPAVRDRGRYAASVGLRFGIEAIQQPPEEVTLNVVSVIDGNPDPIYRLFLAAQGMNLEKTVFSERLSWECPCSPRSGEFIVSLDVAYGNTSYEYRLRPIFASVTLRPLDGDHDMIVDQSQTSPYIPQYVSPLLALGLAVLVHRRLLRRKPSASPPRGV